MKVVVTGAAGFIGAHVTRSLTEAGHAVVGVDSFTDFHAPDLKLRRWESLVKQPASTLRRFDVADDDHFERLIIEEMPDTIIHLAALAGIRYAQKFPERCLRSNVIGSFKVFDAAASNEIPRVIYASSSSVYGNVQGKCREDDRSIGPRSLYGASKLSCEILARSFWESRGLRTIGARFFTTYGEWGRPDMAYFRLVVAALTNTEFPLLGDLNVRRDFTYVADIVNVVTALSSPNFQTDDPALVVNVGGGSPCSLAQLISLVETVTRSKVRHRDLPHTNGDVASTNASTERLASLSLPLPSTSLREGIERTAQWIEPILDEAARWVQWTAEAEAT